MEDPPHSTDQECPAKGKTCNKCSKAYTFARVCRSSDVKSTTHRSEKEHSNESDHKPTKVGSIRVGHVGSKSRRIPRIRIKCYSSDGKDYFGAVLAVPDPGAEGSIAGLEFLRKVGEHENNLLTYDTPIMAANNQNMKSLGCLWITLEYGGRKTEELIIICPEHDGILLSLSACINLGMIPREYPNPLPISINNVTDQRSTVSDSLGDPLDLENERARIMEFADVFELPSDNLPVMAGQPMVIELKEDAVPYAVNGARPIPYAQRDEVKRMLDEMETNGVIVKVTEPSDWAHPLIGLTRSSSCRSLMANFEFVLI